MKQRYRLLLFAAALLCAVPRTAPAQTIRLKELPRDVPRVSHVPIKGGVEPGLADEFLKERLQDAETAAQMERLLNDLAEHPERLGIKEEDRNKLKEARERAGDQPEKMLQDPAVQRIIEDAARNKKLPDLTTEERKSLDDLASRYFPPPASSPPDSGKPDLPDKPDISRAETPPKPPDGANPATPLNPTAPGAEPMVPPRPTPTPAAKSPVNDRLRDLAETLADKGLADSPAFRRMLTNLDRVKAPDSSRFPNWGQRFQGLENRFADIGARLPKFSWPKGSFSPRERFGRFGPADDPARDAPGGRGGQVVLLILAAMTAAAVAWGVLRRRGVMVLRRAGDGRRLGPWPVRPEAVSTRDDLVRAFEHLALLLLGPAARTSNHREIAAGLAQHDAARRLAADRLAGLYEQARYAPPDEALPGAELAAARAALSLLAGVAAA